MSRMTEGETSGTGVEDCKGSVIPFDRLRTGVDRMRGCPQEGNQERRAVVFLPFVKGELGAPAKGGVEPTVHGARRFAVMVIASTPGQSQGHA